MDSWEKTALRIINQIHHPPKKKYQLDLYYVQYYDQIKVEIEILLCYEISTRQLDVIIAAWNYQYVLIEAISRYDLPKLKEQIKQLIHHLEQAEKIHKELQISLDIISPITKQPTPFHLFNINAKELLCLNTIRSMLDRSNGGPCSDFIFTKMAYFELFFIAESLGLAPPTLNYQSSDLLSFVEIITKPSLPTRHTLSDYYQKYIASKQSNDKLAHKTDVLVMKCQEYAQDSEIWISLLSVFQDHICPKLLS